MTYQELNAQTVVAYIAEQPELQHFFKDFSQLVVTEIGDGNVNYVYRIKDEQSGRSVILKQAVPYLRCVGESFPLTRLRMDFEILALQTARKYCPAHVPEIFHHSSEQSLIVMQDLADHRILRGEIIKGTQFPSFAEHISSYMADTLFYTSDLHMASEDKKAMAKKFVNISLCKLTEDFVFSNPYIDHETNVYNEQLSQAAIDKVQKDQNVKVAVAQMRYKFKNNAQALLHGDLHIGSIMVNAHETYVIDPEFAFFGPMGFDVGAVIGNLFMSYFSHAHEDKIQGEQTKAHRAWLLETIEQVWLKFNHKFTELWLNHENKDEAAQWDYAGGVEAKKAYMQAYMSELFADTLGFAACKMMRRVLGLAKVADFADIEDLKARAEIERNIIDHATDMIVNRYQYNEICQLTELAKRIDG